MKRILAALAASAFLSGTADAAVLTNGDFETGDFTGWTTGMSGIHGQNLVTAVQSFDVTGAGASLAAVVQPGTDVVGQYAGAFLTQTFTAVADGLYDFSVDIASYDNVGAGNMDGGLVNLVIADMIVSSVNFADIFLGVAERATLSASRTLAAGSYDFTIQVLRQFNADVTTPLIFADNASVTHQTVAPAAVPLPAGMPLMLLALGAIAVMGSRRRS
ncbi:MAG: VPLPA-CTERM sorting domain-containing protein [Roseivivax sp.]|nr:VPLPA-CTERM sorting domain-containing protein [Roseivivax sp.]